MGRDLGPGGSHHPGGGGLAGGLAEEVEVGGHAVDEHEPQAHAVAVVVLALELVHRSHLDLSGGAGDDDVALELHSRAPQRVHSGDVGHEGVLHVHDAVAEDAVVLQHRVVLPALSDEVVLVAAHRRVRVPAHEHGRSPAGTGQPADGVVSIVVDVLEVGAHSHFPEHPIEQPGHVSLFAGGARRVDHLGGEIDDHLPVDQTVKLLSVHCAAPPVTVVPVHAPGGSGRVVSAAETWTPPPR